MLRSVYLRMSDCNEWFVSDNPFRLQPLLFLHYFRISGLYSLAFAALIVEYGTWFVSDKFRISGPHSLAYAAKRRILIVNDLFQIISWPAPALNTAQLSGPPALRRPTGRWGEGGSCPAVHCTQAAVLYTCQLYSCTLPGPVISLLSRTSRMETPRKTSQLTTHNILSSNNIEIKSLF